MRPLPLPSRRQTAGQVLCTCSILAAFVLGISSFRSASAKPDDDTRYRFEQISMQSGLSHNAVYAILQDHYGFMWIGTENGLNKYDGHDFTIYEREPGDSLSLSDNRIESLLIDSQGTLWIGTRHGGLNRFRRQTENFVRYPFYDCGTEECNKPDGLNGAFVSSLHEDASGGIWIGTFHGLSRLDPETDRFEHFRHVPGNPRTLSSDKVWCLEEGPEGKLYVGTWNAGLNVFDASSRAFTQYNASQIDGPHLTGDRIRSIESDRYGDVWIGVSGGGLNRYDPDTDVFSAFWRGDHGGMSVPDNRIWSTYQDSRGILWIGTFGGGLARYDRTSGQFRHFVHNPDDPATISSNVISVIYEDRSGNLWIGSDRGLSIYNLGQERHQHFIHNPDEVNSLSNSEVLALHAGESDPDLIWIGTNGGGLDRFDFSTQTFRRFDGSRSGTGPLTNAVVTSIDEDAEGRLWIGTNGQGLHLLDPKAGFSHAYENLSDGSGTVTAAHVLDVHVDRSGDVWIATDGGGLYRLEPETGDLKRFRNDPYDPTSISDNTIQTIHESRSGVLWIGTIDGGLNRYSPSSETFKTYRHAAHVSNSLSHNRITSIYEDDDGLLWIGSYAGLNRLDPSSGEFRRYTRDDGLPVEPYLSITGDGNGLWLTSASRLTYFDPESGLVRHFSDRNGLSPNNYSTGALVVTESGSIIVGGRNGFSHFQPPLPESSHDRYPPVVVTALKKMNEVVEREIFSDETVTLSYADRFFTIEFAVLDYTNPEKHRYEYKLEGYDSNWQHMTGTIGRASYANFKPDREEYIFRVRAANSQGAWNTLWLRLRVIPPWWQTLWFKISAVLGLGLMGGSAAMYRYNRQKREKAETLRLLTEGRERERQYLARELHDSPLQNLYSIRHKLEVLSRNPADPDNSKMLDDVHGVIESTAEDLRILCGELRPPSLGPFGLEKAIRAHVRTIKRSTPDLSVNLELTPDGQELPEHLRHSLFRIYQSAITNVIRHAEAENLWVTFELLENRVLLEIKDDGRGFVVPKSWLTLARSQHFGLLGISEWAEAIEAELSVDSHPGGGTIVRVVAPRRVGADA